MTTTQTEIQPVMVEDAFPYEDDHDPHARAHIVDFLGNKKLDELYAAAKNATEVVEIARVCGIEVLAICGYRWVPKRNPTNHETCAKCLAIWKGMK